MSPHPAKLPKFENSSCHSAFHAPLSALLEIWQYRPLLLELVRRDLKLRYKNSVGGIAWSLLNPLMQIAVITIVMKFILVNPVENYSAYLFVLFLWNFFQVSLMDSCVTILHNGSLVRRVYFPRAILPLATLLGNLLHFGIAFVFTIVYLFMLGTYPNLLRWEILMVFPATFFLATLTLGVSFVLSYLNVFYEDVRFIVIALLQVFFYTMPILYPIEKVYAYPNPLLYKLYMLNPVATLLVTYQRALLPPPIVRDVHERRLPPVDIPWDYFAIACVTSVCILIIGFLLFEYYKWEMVERL